MQRLIYLYYPADGEATACLELMRRVLQPQSKSLPHITLRHAPVGYESTSIDQIYLDADPGPLIIGSPASFDDETHARDALATVVFKAEAPSLEHLSYKPDFADSVFHLTIYAGARSQLAYQVLNALRASANLHWRLQLPAAGRVVRYDDMGSVPRVDRPGQLTDIARRVLQDRVGVSERDLQAMDTDERVSMVVELAGVLHALLPAAPPPVRSGWAKWPKLGVSVRQGPSLSRDGVVARQLTLLTDGEAEERLDLQDLQADVVRRAAGTVMTPPELASDVTMAALDAIGDQPIDFGDPCVGTGILFANLQRQLKGRRLASAQAFEIDPLWAEMTRERWAGEGLSVTTADFLAQNSLQSTPRNLILANPPYRRPTLDEKLSFASLSREAGPHALALPAPLNVNLYVHFLLRAHEWLAPEGVAAWILPQTFMASDYGRVVRRYLRDHVETLRIHTYSLAHTLFSNARVLTSVVIFKNVKPTPATTSLVTVDGTLRSPLHSYQVQLGRTDPLAKWTATGRRLDDFPETFGGDLGGSSSKSSDMSSSRKRVFVLEDLFKVRRGIATGDNSTLVLSDSEVVSLRPPSTWIRPVLPKARFIDGDVVSARSDGSPDVDHRQWLISNACDIDVLADRHPDFHSYLKGALPTLLSRTLIRRRRYPLLQEDLGSPLLAFSSLAREGGRRDSSRMLLNNSSATILNNYHGLFPVGPLADMLREGTVTGYEIMAALRDGLVGGWRWAGRRHSALLVKVEPSDLRSLPLQGWLAGLAEEVRALVSSDSGQQMHGR